MSKKSKLIHFQFSLPITEITRDGIRFGTRLAGQLEITGTGKIDPEYEKPPQDAADLAAWIKIKFDSIKYLEVDLRPVFNLPDAKPLLQMIIRAAENNCHSIATL